MVIRPEPHSSPSRKIVGTDCTPLAATSSRKVDPSTAVCLMLGLSTLMALRACTTVGQLTQLSDM